MSETLIGFGEMGGVGGSRSTVPAILFHMTDSPRSPRRQFTVRSIFVWMTATALLLAVLRTINADPVAYVVFPLWFAGVAVGNVLIGDKASLLLSMLLAASFSFWGVLLYTETDYILPMLIRIVLGCLFGCLFGAAPPLVVAAIVLICRWIEKEPDNENEQDP